MILFGNFLNGNRFLIVIFVILLALSCSIIGCQDSRETNSGIELDWNIQPDPPAVGMATINISLSDSTGQLISGANVKLEGNMSHPGMLPVFAPAQETEPGTYSADIEFTMGGDWFFLVECTLPDSRVIERQININGVRSQ